MSNALSDAHSMSSSSEAAEPAAPEQLSLFETFPVATEGHELYVAAGQGCIGKNATMALQNTPASG